MFPLSLNVRASTIVEPSGLFREDYTFPIAFPLPQFLRQRASMLRELPVLFYFIVVHTLVAILTTVATTGLMQVACENNFHIVFMHTKLTANGVLKSFLKERSLFANKLTFYSSMNRNKKP